MAFIMQNSENLGVVGRGHPSSLSIDPSAGLSARLRKRERYKSHRVIITHPTKFNETWQGHVSRGPGCNQSCQVW